MSDQNQKQIRSQITAPADRILRGGWIGNYLEYTSAQESPELFHLWTAFSIIAGALRRNVHIGRGYYKLYPNLYVVLVAPTGKCRKSTATSIGVKILREVDGVNIVHEKITPEGLIMQLKLTVPEIEKQPDNVKMKCDNCVFVFAPELSVFIGSASYTTSLTEILTSLFEGKDDWDYTTKTRGKEKLYNVNVNILGASNAEWLSKGFQDDSFGGGFMGRIIFVFQNENRRKVAWPTPTPEQAALRLALVSDLQKISRLRGEFTIEDNAYDFFKTWYETYEGSHSWRLSGYYERKPEYILKLAMIISVANRSDLHITALEMMAAKTALDIVEPLMTEAFGYIGATNEARISQHILEIMHGSSGIITHKRLLSAVRHLVRNSREFMDLINTLEESGIIQKLEINRTRSYLLKAQLDEIIARVATQNLSVNEDGELVSTPIETETKTEAETTTGVEDEKKGNSV